MVKVITEFPAPTAVTVPFASTTATDSLLDLKTISRLSGTVAAWIVPFSPIINSIVSLSTLTEASFNFTVILTFLSFAAAYLWSPANENVIMASPGPTA